MPLRTTLCVSSGECLASLFDTQANPFQPLNLSYVPVSPFGSQIGLLITVHSWCLGNCAATGGMQSAEPKQVGDLDLPKNLPAEVQPYSCQQESKAALGFWYSQELVSFKSMCSLLLLS